MKMSVTMGVPSSLFINPCPSRKFHQPMVFSEISRDTLSVDSVDFSKPPPNPARRKGAMCSLVVSAQLLALVVVLLVDVFLVFPNTIPFKTRQVSYCIVRYELILQYARLLVMTTATNDVFLFSISSTTCLYCICEHGDNKT